MGIREWFYVNVPTTTTGTMSVTVQSSNLSSLSPKLQVYNSSLSLDGAPLHSGSMGATITVSLSVQPGQGYYFKVLAAGGPGAIGGYGLLVNFGSQSQPPIPPPNTVVAQQPDKGGGTANDNAPTSGIYGIFLRHDRHAYADGWTICTSNLLVGGANNSNSSTQTSDVTAARSGDDHRRVVDRPHWHSRYGAVDLLLSSIGATITPSARHRCLPFCSRLKKPFSEGILGSD